MTQEAKIAFLLKYCDRNHISLCANFKITIPGEVAGVPMEQVVSNINSAFVAHYPPGKFSNCHFHGTVNPDYEILFTAN